MIMEFIKQFPSPVICAGKRLLKSTGNNFTEILSIQALSGKSLIGCFKSKLNNFKSWYNIIACSEMSFRFGLNKVNFLIHLIKI